MKTEFELIFLAQLIDSTRHTQHLGANFWPFLAEGVWPVFSSPRQALGHRAVAVGAFCCSVFVFSSVKSFHGVERSVQVWFSFFPFSFKYDYWTF